ncbi:helix-turn-helix transcriptional regulator [Marinilongibacter aquaticus]|uniref:helix-turn-helix domain-containing protein n=1 Tax=Marinilongibacter aquaticus TaxID=2975157 RepID=UPI0021BDEA78|nr:helix-turn-helix transcriptional regulator [Marinilongibacter aquaticus]UBM58215.1 helix-turn-helix transcriptional regulator [Marinilongibacter aquaticus]
MDEKHRLRIGRKIRELREAANLTQDQLAEMTGLKKPNLSRIENGKYNTGLDILSRIAEALGKKLDIV